MFNRALLTVLGILVFQGSVQAHQLRVFAHAKQDRIAGEVYFAGGQKLENSRVSLSNLSGDDEIATTRTDADGRFSFPVNVRQGYRISANSGDGHVAHWDVQMSEVIMSDPASHSLQTPNPASSPPLHEPQSDNLKTLIESAVSGQVAPLRAELQEVRDERRIQDILGGIGYIVGLAGLGMFWLSRRRGSRQ
jgi:nickel transport protein